MSLYLISSFAIYSVNMDLCILCDAFFLLCRRVTMVKIKCQEEMTCSNNLCHKILQAVSCCVYAPTVSVSDIKAS